MKLKYNMKRRLRDAGLVTALIATIFFLIFAWDIENDRDMFTWIWFGNSIIFGVGSLVCWNAWLRQITKHH